jgi:hypothetical protein
MTDIDAVTDALRSAHEAVDAAGVPQELRVAAFEKAATALLSPVGPPGPGTEPRGMGAPGTGADSDSAVGRAARKLQVEEVQLSRVLDFDEDGVHVLLQRSRFSSKKSEAIQQVALLVVAGRQAGGLDPEGWTHQGQVRDATEALGVDDRKNFALHLKRLDGVRTRGSGRTGELKMNAVGFEAAGELLRRLAAETEAG